VFLRRWTALLGQRQGAPEERSDSVQPIHSGVQSSPSSATGVGIVVSERSARRSKVAAFASAQGSEGRSFQSRGR